jgi:uncharacterized protein YndB with AHSA1/START domain
MKPIDLPRALGALTRTVAEREHGGRPARVVVATRTFDTTIEDAWDAVTSAERIPRWFLPISGELRLGGRFQLQGNAGGEITRCDRPDHLAVTWEFGGEVSWVEVRLTAESAERTRLELEHVAHVTDDRWKQFGPGAVGVGWELALLGLTLHFETGEAVDPVAFMAWMESAEAKALVRGSSDGWRDASIASGTDAAEATAAAERCAGFYTGEP